MSITILNYHDQALVDQINTQAAQRAEAAKASSVSTDSDFASALSEASKTDSTGTVSLTDCSEELTAIFEEAASTFGVSVNLLKAIARAESNFNPNAVSSAGAIGIMQLMPATAASLGVTNSYDARENIMGGAKLISQLLSKYNGDTSLALAAYNAGSGNVDKYGGIPPFTETQNYVKKVLSYMNAEVKENVSDVISNFLSSNNVSSDTLDLFVSLLKLIKEETASSKTAAATASATATTAGTITATVVDGSHIVDITGGSSASTDSADSTAAVGTGTDTTNGTGSASTDSTAVTTEQTSTDTPATDTVTTDPVDNTQIPGDTTGSSDAQANTSETVPAAASETAATDTTDNTKVPADNTDNTEIPAEVTDSTQIPADNIGNTDIPTDNTGSLTPDASGDISDNLSVTDALSDTSVSETV